MKKNLFGTLAILVCLVVLGSAVFADNPNTGNAANNNASATAQGGAGYAAVLPVVTGSGQTDGADAEQILPSGNFRYAYWQCSDGYAEKSGSESSCKPAKLWKQYGNEFCQQRCAQNPSGSKECGRVSLAAVKVYNECQAGNAATTEQVQSTTSTAAVLRKVPNMNLDSEGLRQLVTKLVERLDYLEQRTNLLEDRVSRLEKLLALTPQTVPTPVPTDAGNPVPVPTTGTSVAIQSVSADRVVTNQATIVTNPSTANTAIGVENGLPVATNTTTQSKTVVPVTEIRNAVFEKIVKSDGINWATQAGLENQLVITPKVNANGNMDYTVKYQVPNKTPILNWFNPTTMVEGTVTQQELKKASSTSQPTFVDLLYLEKESS